MSDGILLDRIPPQNLDAERSTLGAMFLEKEAIYRAMEIIRPEDFYKDSHRILYQTVLDLTNRGEPVDLVTVTEELRQKNLLEKVGGVNILTELAGSVPTAAHVEFYARIVEEKSLLRQLIHAATEIVSLGYDGQDEVNEIIDRAEHLVFSVANRRSGRNVTNLKNLLIETFEQIEKLYESRGAVTGVPTGFSDLDRLTAGFQPSDLIILAARPSMGKTTFALNIAEFGAINLKLPVVVFSLEMSKEQLAMKLLCSEAGVDNQRIRTGNLREEDWPRLSHALGRLSEATMFIDDSPSLSVLDVRAKARRIKSEHGLGLIIVDYLQLMQGRARAENRQQEVSEISRGLKALARELAVPVIALSQLSRAVEQRQNKRPALSDLRESGSLEQDADLVCFLYREDYYEPETEKKNITEFIIAKHRNGPLGTIEFHFQKEYSKFIGLERFRKPEK